MKILIIVALVAFLLYLLARRFMLAVNGEKGLVSVVSGRQFTRVDSSPASIAQATKSTVRSVATGFLLLILILLLGIKIKILWIISPLALYLIGQVFVYINQLKYTKDQRIYFNPENNEVLVDFMRGRSRSFNLLRDVRKVSEVRSVQKNGNILFGYYKLHLRDGAIVIPYLVEQHVCPINKLFFSYLNEQFKIEVERRLFPIA